MNQKIQRACALALNYGTPVRESDLPVEAWDEAEHCLSIRRAEKAAAERKAAEEREAAVEREQQAEADAAAARVMSMDEFQRIQTGMSYDEVVQIVGGPGELLSSSEIAGYKTEMFMWDGSGSLGANANVMFQNNAVVSKAQFGLS